MHCICTSHHILACSVLLVAITPQRTSRGCWHCLAFAIRVPAAGGVCSLARLCSRRQLASWTMMRPEGKRLAARYAHQIASAFASLPMPFHQPPINQHPACTEAISSQQHADVLLCRGRVILHCLHSALNVPCVFQVLGFFY